jgi:hypothetical protein
MCFGCGDSALASGFTFGLSGTSGLHYTFCRVVGRAGRYAIGGFLGF